MNNPEPRQIDLDFIKEVEKHHFRSAGDTGAHPNAMMIWNIVRRHVGLPRLTEEDLPRYCVSHDCYHVIRLDYGCQERKKL
jgi:hypothetical protein